MESPLISCSSLWTSLTLVPGGHLLKWHGSAFSDHLGWFDVGGRSTVHLSPLTASELGGIT